MAQLLERLVDQTTNGNGQTSGRIVSRVNPHERFRRQRPQEFSGTTDPLIAESWIKSIEVPGSDQIHRESGTSTVGGGRSPNPVHDWKQDSFITSIRSTTRNETPSSACTRRPDEIGADGFSSSSWPEQFSGDTRRRQLMRGGKGRRPLARRSHFLKSSSYAQHIELIIRAGISIQYLCDPQWFRDTASRGPTTIVAPESQFRTRPTDHDSIGYPRMSASGESSTTMHRLLHASGSHPIPPPDDPKTNQYNQDLGLIHSTNGNHLESPNEGSSIDHQVTIYLHAQNITMFPTNETWYFASQILVSSSGGLILILMAQSTRNMFRIHSLYSMQLLIIIQHNEGICSNTHRIKVKRQATSPHDPLGITDSACKNQLVMVSVQYGPFNTYIPIRSMTIGKPRVARDPITMHTSWRSNSDIASVTRVSMTLRVVRTNQYNQDLRLIHSTNGNHLESPNEGSSIDHQIQQMLFALITSRKIQSRATVDPVASFAYPVDMESSRKKADVVESYNPDARFQSQYLKIQQRRKAAVDLNQKRSS
ncbi:hypothetical protein F511_03733 [Dorcoceras hygrometricum]|uniref:Uncharacterized protein n=1 Tax=Dorcoceras hygrometricum TaxID=472368 RepID=A0A2Z7B9L2_9LAMI|nr:hypothetical protein F511_03733 [Dorcoceras hygrometricum]